MKNRMYRVLTAIACLVASRALGEYVLYDDFTWPTNVLDRTKWWRGGLEGVDGTNAILNESDLTSSLMFLFGDFKFVMGGPSSSSQALIGLGDIDDGEPFLVLSDKGAGWRFHVRNGSAIYTGPVIASSLAKGDVVVFHWDSSGSTVAINGVVKGSQTAVHPPRMPLAMLEWSGTATQPDKASGRIVLDSVSYLGTPVSFPKPAMKSFLPSPGKRVLSAKLVEDTFVDSSNAETVFNGSAHQIHIRNCNHHPDLTGAGKTVDAGYLGLVQFLLPQLPDGWNVSAVRLAGVVAQNHKQYGMPGWAPSRPNELEVLGLDVNPDLAAVTYKTLYDVSGNGVIKNYTSAGSVNFTFGNQAKSLVVMPFDTSATPVGSLLHIPDQADALCLFVREKISRAESKVITLAIGPGRTQAVSGMDCDFKFYAKENTAGQGAMSISLELEPAP